MITHLNNGLSRALPCASVRRRLASLLYEALLLLGVVALGFLVPHLAIGFIWKVAIPGVLLWAHLFVLLGCYFVWYWRHGGQTLAMQTWRLWVVDARSGKRPSLPQAWLRFGLSWPSLLFFGVGIFWLAVDRDRQFLHDRLAATRIVATNPFPISQR
ncbi:MAG: hypothetical protein AMXMBFR6_21680 [Betaproteobacteria bacterium]